MRESAARGIGKIQTEPGHGKGPGASEEEEREGAKRAPENLETARQRGSSQNG